MNTVPIEIPPVYYLQQTLLLLVENFCFAFLVVVFNVLKVDALHTSGNSFDPERKLDCEAEQVGIFSEIQIVAILLYHLRNILFTKRVTFRCLKSEFSSPLVGGSVKMRSVFISTSQLPCSMWSGNFSRRNRKMRQFFCNALLSNAAPLSIVVLCATPKMMSMKTLSSLAIGETDEEPLLVRLRSLRALLVARS